MQETETIGDVPIADRIEAVQSDGVLSAAAKAVMIRLLLRHPEVKTRDACPGPAMLAPWLCLTERSVRRAYAELQQFGWLGGTKDRSLQRPIMSGEDDPLTLADHVASLEWLRDRAVAAGRIGAAVTAEKAAGKVMGFYDRPALQARAARNVRAAQSPPSAIAGGELGGGGNALIDHANPSPPPPRPSPELTLEGGRSEPAETGAALDPVGAAPARTGSNWRELADFGRPRSGLTGRDREEYFNRLSALMDDPEMQAEIAAAPGPEPGSEWALWEAGLRARRDAAAPASGQKCPPPATPPPPAEPSPLRDFVPWNEIPVDKPYDPLKW